MKLLCVPPLIRSLAACASPEPPFVPCRPHRRRLGSIAFFALFLASRSASAQAGPPFRIDDPETPGSGHWEINIGFLGDRSPSDGDYQTPDLDLNYGLGDRIQLKYELPIAVHENRSAASLPATPGAGGAPATAGEPRQAVGGLGESLLGVKWRFYEHHAAPSDGEKLPAAGTNDPEPDFSVSTYPQLSLDNPTRSVRRSVVEPGPQFLLPVEANARFGLVRVDAEAGYWFTNRRVPQSWTRGLLVGHEFTLSTELYLELADEQDANRVEGLPKAREAVVDFGGRHALNRSRNVLALFMGGRSFQKTADTSTQPSWLAYVGVQLLLSPRREAVPQELFYRRLNSPR